MTVSLPSGHEGIPPEKVNLKKLEDKKVERLLAVLAKKMELAREGGRQVRVA